MRGLILRISGLFALVAHIWTVYLGFTEAGILGGVASLLLPVLAEIYWVFQKWGQDTAYIACVFIPIILSAFASLFGRRT